MDFIVGQADRDTCCCAGGYGMATCTGCIFHDSRGMIDTTVIFKIVAMAGETRP